jgi:hypothetical protein
MIDFVFDADRRPRVVGGFRRCPRRWFRIGGIVSPLLPVVSDPAGPTRKTGARRSPAATSASRELRRPEDMSTMSLIGGGLIAAIRWRAQRCLWADRHLLG